MKLYTTIFFLKFASFSCWTKRSLDCLVSLHDLTHQPESPTKWIDTSHCLKPKNTYWYFKLHIWTIYSLRSTKSNHFQPLPLVQRTHLKDLSIDAVHKVWPFSPIATAVMPPVCDLHTSVLLSKIHPFFFRGQNHWNSQRKKTKISRKWLLVQIVGCHFL